MKILSSLPPILKLEIEHPLFKDSGKQVDTLNKIARMLAPNFENDKDKKAAGLEWISFCQGFRLTAPEIVEAYTMALKKELKIFDENKAHKSSEYEGEFIKIFPNLSLITAGEILNAYIEHKKIDKQIEIGRKTIENYLNVPVEVSPEERRERDLILWKKLETAVLENKPCFHASYFYKKLILKGYFKNFVGNTNAQWILIKRKMLELLESYSKSKSKRFINETEASHLRRFCKENNYQIPETSQFAFDLFYYKAISEIQNDLVYNLVKKQLKKKANETRNEKSDSDIPEEPER